MSSIILTIPVGDGSESTLDVEVDLEDQEEGVQLAAQGTGFRARFTSFSLAAALDNVLPALDEIIGRVRRGSFAADEIGVEIGLKVGGEQGLILTKGTAEANVKLIVKWRARRDPDDPTEESDS